MKLRTKLSLLVVGSVLSAAAAQPPLGKRIETLEKRVAELEKRVAQLETPENKKGAKKGGVSPESPVRRTEQASTQKEKKKCYPVDKVTVELIKKEVKQIGLASGNTEKQLQIMLMFTNTTDTDIRKFDGEITFKKTTGEKIITFDLAFDKPIEAGKKASWYGAIDVDPLKSGALLTLDKNEITAEYGIRSAVFSDGSTKKF
ncbi:MAG: hypothetical protein GF350_11755 [Chitinivibrionales bacterium]|nr:hypothetical protein [Chitinivibrionales bacterium]